MEVLTSYLSSPNLSAELESLEPAKSNRAPEIALMSLQLLTALVQLIPLAKAKQRPDKGKR